MSDSHQNLNGRYEGDRVFTHNETGADSRRPPLTKRKLPSESKRAKFRLDLDAVLSYRERGPTIQLRYQASILRSSVTIKSVRPLNLSPEELYKFFFTEPQGFSKGIPFLRCELRRIIQSQGGPRRYPGPYRKPLPFRCETRPSIYSPAIKDPSAIILMNSKHIAR